MSDWIILLPILLPIIGAILVFITPKKLRVLQRTWALLFTAAALVVTIIVFGQSLTFTTGWAGFGIDFDLRLDKLSSFIVLAAGFAFLAVLYSAVTMKGTQREGQFFGFVLLASGFVAGALLANNIVLMLFFWEGLLAVMFGLIMTGNKGSKAAIKAFMINATADICLLAGVGISVWQAGTITISMFDHVAISSGWVGAGFILMMIGATARAGAMPFHTWIPDASQEAPVSFMAFLPAALDKVAGIYLLARITLDMFHIIPNSGLSITMMVIGACTILFAVMMALIQTNFKKLLSYHAISQVGYMVLGIGTALPIGIVGGLFHMVNHAMYKSALFYSAGAVERQTGTTELKDLGGLGRKMPITFICFIIAAAAISGVPPLNGFFSKELVFDAALNANVVFYIVAIVGAFFTAASFLKLGHTAFFGKPSKVAQTAKEAPWPMLVPLIVLAAGCVLFGVYNPLPLQHLIEPALGGSLTQSFAGLPHNWILAAISVGVLLLAVANHYFGVKRSGSALGSSDHFHYAPGLKPIYAAAEAGVLDPYIFCGKLLDVFSIVLDAIDKAVDWIYQKLAPGIAGVLGAGISKAHTGKHWMYVLWILGGAVVIALIFIVGGGG